MRKQRRGNFNLSDAFMVSNLKVNTNASQNFKVIFNYCVYVCVHKRAMVHAWSSEDVSQGSVFSFQHVGSHD